MKNVTLGIGSINCIIESAAKAYGFNIFTYNPKTGLISTMKKSDSSTFLETVIKRLSCKDKSNLKYVDVIIRPESDIKPSGSKNCASQDLSQANNCVEDINEQGFLFI